MLTEIKHLFRLAMPIFIAQLSLSSMSLVDTVMAGNYAKLDLAAVAVAGSIWLPALLFTQACLYALTPIVAQAFGRGDDNEAQRFFHQGLWLGALLGGLVALLVLSILPLLGFMGIDEQLLEISQRYLSWIVIGLPFAGLYQAMRSFVEGYARTKAVMVINISALLANIPLNYIFIFGKLGLPAMGGAGCGVASALVLLAMALMMMAYILMSTLKHKSFVLDWVGLDFSRLCKLIAIGAPIGLSILAEVSIFAVLAIIIAPLGATVVAGHQVALNLSAQTFMLPLSIGSALTIRVGFFLGRNDTQQVKKVIYAGLVMALCASSLTASFMWGLRDTIAAIYTRDIDVQLLAVSLLLFAAIYQFPDAIQVCSAGILRAFKKTTLPMVSVLVAYWVIALPVGICLAFSDVLLPAMGVKGLWLGLVVGLTAAAIFLFAQLLWVLQRLHEPG